MRSGRLRCLDEGCCSDKCSPQDAAATDGYRWLARAEGDLEAAPQGRVWVLHKLHHHAAAGHLPDLPQPPAEGMVDSSLPLYLNIPARPQMRCKTPALEHYRQQPAASTPCIPGFSAHAVLFLHLYTSSSVLDCWDSQTYGWEVPKMISDREHCLSVPLMTNEISHRSLPSSWVQRRRQRHAGTDKGRDIRQGRTSAHHEVRCSGAPDGGAPERRQSLSRCGSCPGPWAGTSQ